MDQHHKNVRLVQEAVERKCAGLLPDPFLAQRVLNAAEKKPRERKPFSVGLAFALVLMTVVTVAVSLNRKPEIVPPQVVTSSLPEGEEQGFTHVSPGRQLLPASSHTCKYYLHRTEQLCYRYYDGKQDVLSTEFVAVCSICGKLNGLSYAPHFDPIEGNFKDADALIEAQIKENMRDHEWVVYDKHIEGTDTHEFTRVCTRCRTRWVPVVLPCMGGDDHIAPDMDDIWPQD